MRTTQRGVTLIELILVIALLALMSALSFYEKQTEFEQERARSVGGMLFQFNNAVRDALAQNNPGSSTTYQGSSWLKSSVCGGLRAPGQELLPCDFPLATAANPIPFGNLSLSTTIVVTSASPTNKFTATTTASPFQLQEGGAMKTRSDLSGIAVLAAASAVGAQIQPLNGGLPASGGTDTRYASDSKTGIITFTSSNTGGNDIWLKTDGSNYMHKSLQFSGAAFADRQILGASRIQNIAGQALTLGAGSGLSPVTGSSVVIDNHGEILGEFRNRRNLQVDGNTRLSGQLAVAGPVNVGGSITATGNVRASANAYAQFFIDANDPNYYFDPNGGSHINVLYARFIYDKDNPGYYIDPNGTSRLNQAVTNTTYASLFYDLNNTGYYLQPSGGSRLSGITSDAIYNYGRMTVGEYVQLNGVATNGAGCAPNGLLGRAVDGSALSCVNGAWAKMGGGAPTCYWYTIPGYASNNVTLWNCPAGFTKIGWDTTGKAWRRAADGTVIGENDYALVNCCKF